MRQAWPLTAGASRGSTQDPKLPARPRARTATADVGRAGARATEGSVPEAQGNADAVAFASMPPIAPADGPVLITGASGYIGSWAVYAFVRRGYTVQ